MFGDITFAGGTFADLFVVANQVEYSYRKGRTAVIAIIPEDGDITTSVIVRKLRTKVEKTKVISTNPQTGL